MRPSLPDFEPRVYGPQRIAVVVWTLADDGIAPELTLADSGLTEITLHDPATRVSYQQVATVFRNAACLTRDPTAAFRAGTRMHLTAYGMYGYGLLSSPSFDDQVEFTIKYAPTMGPSAGPVAFSHVGPHGVYAYEVMLTPNPADPLYWFTLQFSYSAHLTVGRDLYGPGFTLVALHAACPAPAQAERFADLFGCPVHFGQRANEVLVAPAWAAATLPMPNLVTHGAVREICQQILVDLTQSGATASIVRRTLVEQMPWRFPTLETMAAALRLHPRTLRRRLEADGTTYRDLLSEVRRRLAIEYLRKTRMSTEEIASRLGYSDAANFRHAFARWTGRTPREYRSP